jgi:hypothetical protein
MGFFTEEELSQLRIRRMNFQVVGDEEFLARPAMRSVEQPDFFLGRIVEVDVGAAFSFREGSETCKVLQSIASGRQLFAAGAVALAKDFNGRHVGQSKPGAFFFFELAVGRESVSIFAMLKYDYSEVLTLRRSNEQEQLRRIMQAFVKDRRALQKSALIRVVDGIAEDQISVTDRAARSPNVTEFFARFLDASRNRNDDELNKEAAHALTDIVKQAPDGTWPTSDARALRAMREALLVSAIVSIESVENAVLIAAGRPHDEDVVTSLRGLTQRVFRRRRLSGLEFPVDGNVFRVASSRRVKTVEHIKIEYPEALDGVRVQTQRNPDGGAVITIQTAGIESDEIVNENLSNIRRRTS